MTADWSPVKVEQAIHECSERIAKGVLKTDAAYKLFLQADHDYDLAFAHAYMDADGPAHERKYVAEIQTADKRKERDAADAAYKLMVSNMRAIQTEMDALRSIGVSIRQAYAVAGRGEV